MNPSRINPLMGNQDCKRWVFRGQLTNKPQAFLWTGMDDPFYVPNHGRPDIPFEIFLPRIPTKSESVKTTIWVIAYRQQTLWGCKLQCGQMSSCLSFWKKNGYSSLKLQGCLTTSGYSDHQKTQLWFSSEFSSLPTLCQENCKPFHLLCWVSLTLPVQS